MDGLHSFGIAGYPGFATRLAGHVPVFDLKDALGHADLRMTTRHVKTASAERTRNGRGQMAEAIGLGDVKFPTESVARKVIDISSIENTLKMAAQIGR